MAPSKAFVYIEPIIFTEEDEKHHVATYNCTSLLDCEKFVISKDYFGRYFDYIKVKLSSVQLETLAQHLNGLIARDGNGNIKNSIEPSEVSPDYPSHSLFFTASNKFWGLFGTCNTMVNKSLGFLNEFNGFKPYWADKLFTKVEEKLKTTPTNCVTVNRK